MTLLRRKAPPIPPRTERPPDLIIDGREMWVVVPARVVYHGGDSYNEGRPLFVLDPHQ